MAPWLKWLIIGLVAFVVLMVVLIFVNRAFRHKYGFSLFGGGFLLLIGVACLAGGIVLAKSGVGLGFALFIVTAITFIFTLVYDFKRCGGAGILAFILQLLFSVPSLLVVFDVLFNRGRATLQASIDEDIYERRRARRMRNKYGDDDTRW